MPKLSIISGVGVLGLARIMRLPCLCQYLWRLCIVCLASSAWADPSPLQGQWQILDSQTQTVRSVMVFYPENDPHNALTAPTDDAAQAMGDNGLLAGRLISVSHPESPETMPRCEACSGTDKNQPLPGLYVVKDIEKAEPDGDAADAWHASILNPDDGRWYAVTLTLSDNGDRLTLTSSTWRKWLNWDYPGSVLMGDHLTLRRK